MFVVLMFVVGVLGVVGRLFICCELGGLVCLLSDLFVGRGLRCVCILVVLLLSGFLGLDPPLLLV